MADIDMEVDTSHPVTLDIQDDEDLIDFDTDMMDHTGNEWGQTDDLPQSMDETRQSGELVKDERNDVPTLMDHDVDVDVDVEVDGLDEILDDVDASVNGGDYAIESDKFDVDDGTSITVAQREEIQEQSQEDPKGFQPAGKTDTGPATDGAEESGSTHEIDYEFEDGKAVEEPSEEEQPNANGELIDDGEEAAGDSIHVKSGTPSAQAGLTEQEDVDDTIVVANPNQDQGDQHEISWDTYESHEAPEDEKKDSNQAVEPHAETEDQAHDEIEVKVNADTINVRLDDEEHDDAEEREEATLEEHDDADDAVEAEEYAAAGEEHEEEHDGRQEVEPQGEQNDGQAAIQSDSGEQSSAETDFPAITVQYKGDEFPMFSGSEGFFTETSVLDDAIGTLLAQLRQELENEIAHEDELVLQIDELGLEFAEVSAYTILQRLFC